MEFYGLKGGEVAAYYRSKRVAKENPVGMPYWAVSGMVMASCGFVLATCYSRAKKLKFKYLLAWPFWGLSFLFFLLPLAWISTSKFTTCTHCWRQSEQFDALWTFLLYWCACCLFNLPNKPVHLDPSHSIKHGLWQIGKTEVTYTIRTCNEPEGTALCSWVNLEVSAVKC